MRVALVAVLLVLAACAGVLAGLVSVGLGHQPVDGQAVVGGSGAAPFAVGSCFSADRPGALRPTSCAGDSAVFVINAVGRTTADCAAVADFGRYGAMQQDVSAHAVYCVSLVVGANGCVVLGQDAQHTAPHRVACGTDPKASRVVKVVGSDNAATACAGVPNADVWYYRSPSSGQLACLTRDGA